MYAWIPYSYAIPYSIEPVIIAEFRSLVSEALGGIILFQVITWQNLRTLSRRSSRVPHVLKSVQYLLFLGNLYMFMHNLPLKVTPMCWAQYTSFVYIALLMLARYWWIWSNAIWWKKIFKHFIIDVDERVEANPSVCLRHASFQCLRGFRWITFFFLKPLNLALHSPSWAAVINKHRIYLE